MCSSRTVPGRQIQPGKHILGHDTGGGLVHVGPQRPLHSVYICPGIGHPLQLHIHTKVARKINVMVCFIIHSNSLRFTDSYETLDPGGSFYRPV